MRIISASLLIISTVIVSGTIGFKLKCSFDNNSCRVNELVIPDPNAITSVNGSIDILYDIDTLVIRHQMARYVPQNIAFFFRKLKHLEITSSLLEWIFQKDMRGLTGLKTLDLSNNGLEVLENGLFDFNLELESIDLSSNRLEFIHERIFYDLIGLHSIDLEHNSCTRLMYSSRTKAKIDDLDYNYSSNDDDNDEADDKNNNIHNDYRSYLSNYNVENRAYVAIGLQTHCQSWERAHEIYRRKYDGDISNLKVDITKLQHRLKICDGNLDAALTNYRQQKLLNSNRVPMDDPIESLMVNMTSFNSACFAINFRVPFPNSSVEIHDCRSDIASLRIHQEESLFLPVNLAKNFPHLRELMVAESGLCEIDRNVLSGLDVSALNLTKNKIAEIAADTFADLFSLQVLDLSFNRLQTLCKGVFYGLPNLQQLYLNNNYLKAINMDVLQPLVGLKSLFLQDNRLKFIDPILFPTFASLESLHLSDNVCIDASYPTSHFEDIEATIIKNCIPPIELTCKMDEISTNVTERCQVENLLIEYPQTKISKIDGVKGPNELIEIFVADKQSIKFIPFELSQQLPKLKRIEIQQSNLISLHKMDFAGCSKLIEVVINRNNLSSIGDGTFDTIPQLQLLDLSSNNIESLPMNIFSNLSNLHTLLLSNNRIHRYSADFMPRRNWIKTFRIDNNQLDLIETKAIRFLRKATIVDLSGNSCIDMKYAETEPNTKALREVVGEIELSCSYD